MKTLLKLVFEVNCRAKEPYKINEQNKEKYTEIPVIWEHSEVIWTEYY